MFENQRIFAQYKSEISNCKEIKTTFGEFSLNFNKNGFNIRFCESKNRGRVGKRLVILYVNNWRASSNDRILKMCHTDKN